MSRHYFHTSLWTYPFLILVLFSCQKREDQSRTSPNLPQNEIVIEEGTNMSVRLSPNQEDLLFDLMGRIWIMTKNGGEAIAITDALGNAREPDWSPDGEQVCFQAYWEGNWQIYTINRDGSNLQQLTDTPYDHRSPVWAPDGQSILFASDEEGNYDIWSFTLPSQSLQQLTNNPFNQYSPSWHPETGFAYVDENPETPGIYWANKQKDHQLLYSSDSPLDAISWAPSGTSLAALENGQLIQINTSNQELPIQSLSQEEEDVFPFKVSWKNQSSFYYTSDGAIKLKDLSNNQETNIPFKVRLSLDRPKYKPRTRNFDATTGLPIKGIFMPKLSPDATLVAFIWKKDLWIRQADGTLKAITNDPFVEIAPIWSPDQKKLAYVSDRSGTFRIIIHNLETGKKERSPTLEGSVAGLSWSPDATKIAYSSSFGPRMGRLYYYNLIDQKIQNLGPRISSSVGAPTWSPDSKYIGVSTLEPFSTKYREGVNGVLIYSMETESTSRTKGLAHFSLGNRSYNGPEWSPDGKFFAGISGARLFLIPIDKKAEQAGKPIMISEDLADAPSWSADAKKILYLSLEGLKLYDLETSKTTSLPILETWDRTVPIGKKIIHAGTLIDPQSGKVLNNQDIIINQNRIEVIERHQPNRDLSDYKFIDASEQFVMPALIDAHSHQGSWDGEQLGRTWLSWGVTSTRDPASDPFDALNRRAAQESGHAVGPRIFHTGSPIDGSRIYYGGANALQDEKQIELELERAKHMDFDLIKTYVRLSDPLQKKVSDAAHAMGIPVSSHELYPAAAFGVDGLEHIKGTSRRGYSPKMSAKNIAYQDVTSLIAESGMSFCPTTGIYVAYNYLLAQDSSILGDVRAKEFMNEFYFQGARQGIAQVKENPKQWERDFRNALQMVKDVYDQGGWIVAGTDGPIIPFGMALHLELESYAAAGLPNLAVLKTATYDAARILNAGSDLGSIEVGKLADLLILNANPLEDIKNLRKMDKVIQNGEVMTLQDLLSPKR